MWFVRFVSILVVSLVLAVAPAVSAVEATQSERGWVTAPMPAYIGVVSTAACSMADTLTGFVAGRHQGMFAYRFRVDSSTRGLPYVLTPDEVSDLDLYFWPSTAESHASKGFAGERGVVPADAQTATVCLASGAPTTFTYVAG